MHGRCRTKDEPPESNSPFDWTAARCHPQNLDRFLAPKPIPRTPQSQYTIPQSKHAITVHQDTSGHATIWRDTSRELSTVKARHLGENVGSEEIKDTSGACPQSGHIPRTRTPWGHAHNQGTSQGQGHLGGTPTIRAHLKDVDTYVCGHLAKEHTSRTRTLSEDTWPV